MAGAGESDQAEVDRLVGRMWAVTDPGSLLHNAWVAYHHHGVVLHSATVAITGLTSEQDAAYLAWLKPRLAAHEGFIALFDRYRALGVEGGFTGHDGYGVRATYWGITVPRESLPRLERLAQDRAGFTSAESRAAAAEAFRRYMAQHYDGNWEENRRTMPRVDRSPYWRPIDGSAGER